MTELQKPGLMAVFRKPHAWALMGLGLSGIVPFLLVGSTLGSWLRSAGLGLTEIGFIQWIGLFYAFKFVWAPFLARLPLLGLGQWLGPRRGLILITQIATCGVLFSLSRIDPKTHLWAFIGCGMALAFCASSQEIANDTWRVSATRNAADQAVFPAAYTIGVKIGILASSSLVFFLAQRLSWPTAYGLMAASQLIGIITTFCLPRLEPDESSDRPPPNLPALRQFLEPISSFFKAYPAQAGLILVTLALYRFPDYLIGPMVTPMYADTHISNDVVASGRATVGLAAGFISVAFASFLLIKIGLRRTFFIGALAGPLSNLMFSVMSLIHGNVLLFNATLIIDDMGDGIAETALVAFMTRFTHRGHVVGHYALMYSVAAMPGKIMKGFSGLGVETMRQGLGLFPAYAVFFAFTAALAVPTVWACLRLNRTGFLDSLS